MRTQCQNRQMNAELIDSVEEFLSVTSAHRGADALRTNVIGSVALSILTERSTYERCRWWVVRDDEGVVVGEALRTSPFLMIVSPMPSAAARELGTVTASLDDDLPGLAGSSLTITSFLDGYRATNSPGSKRLLEEPRRDLLYELDQLQVPDVDGFARPGERRDVDELSQWYVSFMLEAQLPALSLVEATRGVVKSVAAQTLFCWEFDGAIVSFAGHAPTVSTEGIIIGRVGPVYTPPEQRNHGFASAVTATVSQHLVRLGARVMLFTDSTNPTSNRIYQNLGYRLIDEVLNVRFATSP